MAIEYMYAHDPSRSWPLHEQTLSAYISRALCGHAPALTIYQAMGNLDMPRRNGWTPHTIRTCDYSDASDPNAKEMDVVWADIVSGMASDLQSHTELEIIYVRRYDVEIKSISGKPPTFRTYFEVQYDVPPKRSPARSSASSEYIDLVSSASSSPLSFDDDAHDEDFVLNRGARYKRKRETA